MKRTDLLNNTQKKGVGGEECLNYGVVCLLLYVPCSI